MILKVLKESTKIYHDELEQNINLPDQLTSLDEYKHLLAQFWGFYSPIESRLKSVDTLQSLPIDFDQRRKTVLLKQDFQVLGFCDRAVEQFPICTNLPPLENLSQALGCLYVIEGATLGGQIISRHLRHQLGIEKETGGAFFNGYGAETGSMWKSFGAILSDYAANDQIEKEIVGSATATFLAFKRWLSKGK